MSHYFVEKFLKNPNEDVYNIELFTEKLILFVKSDANLDLDDLSGILLKAKNEQNRKAREEVLKNINLNESLIRLKQKLKIV